LSNFHQNIIDHKGTVPIGALTVIGVLVFLHVDQQLEKKEGSIFEQIMRYDPIGNAFFICCVICLLLALQWGGTKYPYSDGKIIALFTLFGIFVVAFIAVEIYSGEQATSRLMWCHITQVQN